MSWGYFLDLNLTLPTPEWERVAQTKTSDHAIGAGWWGFKDKVLGEMFSASEFDDLTIGEVVALFDRTESIGKVDVNGDTTTIRLCQLLDRGGEPSIAKPIAALVDAAKDSANATLRLINDGSYSGEDGVEIVAADGKLSRSHIDGSNELAMKLGSEIYGGEIDEDGELDDELDQAFEVATVDEESHVEGAQAFAVEMGLAEATPSTKPAAKKAAATKPAAKKTAAKKPAAKKPAAKKAAGKKPAVKKAAAKKPGAKKPVAKKPATKKVAGKKVAGKKAAAKKPAPKKAPANKAAAKKPAPKKRR